MFTTDVVLETLVFYESFVTRLTPMGPHPCVQHHVTFEVGGEGEPLLTFWAGILALFLVNCLVY